MIYIHNNAINKMQNITNNLIKLLHDFFQKSKRQF